MGGISALDREAFESLSPRHQDVLQLRLGDGLAIAEIAEKLDIPLASAAILVEKALDRLTRRLSEPITKARPVKLEAKLSRGLRDALLDFAKTYAP
jgi:hypothetical protein